MLIVVVSRGRVIMLAYCQPDSVQAAFGEALRYATLPNFDARAIDLLLNHGAKPSGLWGPGLFEAGALNQQGGVSDPFGLIANLRASKAFIELDERCTFALRGPVHTDQHFFVRSFVLRHPLHPAAGQSIRQVLAHACSAAVCPG